MIEFRKELFDLLDKYNVTIDVDMNYNYSGDYPESIEFNSEDTLILSIDKDSKYIKSHNN